MLKYRIYLYFDAENDMHLFGPGANEATPNSMQKCTNVQHFGVLMLKMTRHITA